MRIIGDEPLDYPSIEFFLEFEKTICKKWYFYIIIDLYKEQSILQPKEVSGDSLIVRINLCGEIYGESRNDSDLVMRRKKFLYVKIAVQT